CRAHGESRNNGAVNTCRCANVTSSEKEAARLMCSLARDLPDRIVGLGELAHVALHLEARQQLGIGSAGPAHGGEVSAALAIAGGKLAPLLGELSARLVLAADAGIDVLLDAKNAIGRRATAWRDVEVRNLVRDQHNGADRNRWQGGKHGGAPGCFVPRSTPAGPARLQDARKPSGLCRPLLQF